MAAAAAIALGGVVACTATTPSPGPSGSAGPSGTARPSVAVTAPAAPSPSPDVVLLDLSDEMDVQRLTPEFTSMVLEHASTGDSVILSAGPEKTEAAPDLYRVLPAVGEPELIWRNEHRDHSLVKIGGEFDRVAFVDMPITGELGWDLWFIPEAGAEPILLDRHPGDPDVPSFAPSFSIYYPHIVWTAFDAGRDGPVSQLLYAEAPNWDPRVITERPAAEAELWFPSLLGNTLVYTEIVYSADRQTDERHAYQLELGLPGDEARRLDTSGLATMPLINYYAILWKEADPGFHMLNWGRLFRYDPDTGAASLLDTSPHDYVNFPSIGERFVAWWGADATRFNLYDLERDEVRQILRYPRDGLQRIIRPHLAGGLLVWRNVDGRTQPSTSEIRYSYLPSAGGDRPGAP